MRTDQPVGVTLLAEHECWDLLRGAEVGRLAVVVVGQPDIFPVNFVVDHGTIVIRTASGSKLAAVEENAGVAFECDGYDPARGRAWSVVLKGQAELLHTVQDLVQTIELPLFPWHAAPKPHFLRIVPDALSGRRFDTVAPDHWDVTSSSGLRRPAPGPPTAGRDTHPG